MSQSHHCHNLRVRPIFQGISAQGEQGGQVGSKPLQANDSGTKWNWVCKTTIHNFYQPPKIVTRPDWSLDCRLQIYTTQTFWNSVALSLGQVLWIYIQNFTSPFMPYALMACPMGTCTWAHVHMLPMRKRIILQGHMPRFYFQHAKVTLV